MRFGFPGGKCVLEIFALMAMLVGGCKTPTGLDEGSGTLAAFVAKDLGYPSIASPEQFEAISRPSEGLIKDGRLVKFLIDWRTPSAPKVWFVNGNYQAPNVPDHAKYHYYFARRHLGIQDSIEDFNKATYFSETKRYVAGTLHTYKLGDDPKPVHGIQFYPQDVIKGAVLFKAVDMVRKAVTMPGASFAFVETGGQQSTAEVGDLFDQIGVKRLTLEGILGSVRYIPMHMGEAWGYLRIFPANQDELTAVDIPVFDDLPLDLTVVAGTITRAFQDTNSHVNLKSKERNTPNAVLRDAGPASQLLAPWNGKPVHMTVGPDGIRFEATTDQVIADKLKQKLNKPWQKITWKKATSPVSYDLMCGVSAASCLTRASEFGSKAASIGYLAHRNVLGRAQTQGTVSNRFGYDLVPIGFGIPLQYYADLVNDPANAKLKAKINDLITREKAGTLSAAARNQALAEVQTLFLNARFPANNLAKIKAMFASTLPGIEKVKIRSSANAEDIEGFDGAGLHDSYSAKPAEADNPDGSCVKEVDEDADGVETKAKMKPRTIACAIKGVYASLWNKRAIEERSFARIDHATVSMGISVLPAYDYQSKIAANSVVVTRVINASDVYGYTLSVQRKNNLVTNPDPGTWSEVNIAAIGVGGEATTLTVTRYAKPKKDSPQLTAPVMAKDAMLRMVDLSQRVERAYCRDKKGAYFQGDCRYIDVTLDKPKALDMEMKILENGNFVVKQMREFSGR